PEFNEAKLKEWNCLGCVLHDYLPIWVPYRYMNHKFHEDFPAPLNRLTLVGQGEIMAFVRVETEHRYQYTAPQPIKATFHSYYFPGWTLYIDGERAESRISPRFDGVISLNLPAGFHDITL